MAYSDFALLTSCAQYCKCSIDFYVENIIDTIGSFAHRFSNKKVLAILPHVVFITLLPNQYKNNQNPKFFGWPFTQNAKEKRSICKYKTLYIVECRYFNY